jgi:hypothetical protein
MSSSVNPYQIKIIELNKELTQIKLNRSILVYDLNEILKYPVPTISPDLLLQDIKIQDTIIEDLEYKIKIISSYILT